MNTGNAGDESMYDDCTTIGTEVTDEAGGSDAGSSTLIWTTPKIRFGAAPSQRIVPGTPAKLTASPFWLKLIGSRGESGIT